MNPGRFIEQKTNDRKRRGPKLLPLGYSPTVNDVLCGRGRHFLSHAGNLKFHNLVKDKLDDYLAARTKLDKSNMVLGIVSNIRDSGGGFIDKDETHGRYYDIGNTLAREKVGHSIRFNLRAQGRLKTKRETKQPSKNLDPRVLVHDSLRSKNDKRSHDIKHVPSEFPLQSSVLSSSSLFGLGGGTSDMLAPSQPDEYERLCLAPSIPSGVDAAALGNHQNLTAELSKLPSQNEIARLKMEKEALLKSLMDSRVKQQGDHCGRMMVQEQMNLSSLAADSSYSMNVRHGNPLVTAIASISRVYPHMVLGVTPSGERAARLRAILDECSELIMRDRVARLHFAEYQQLPNQSEQKVERNPVDDDTLYEQMVQREKEKIMASIANREHPRTLLPRFVNTTASSSLFKPLQPPPELPSASSLIYLQQQ